MVTLEKVWSCSGFSVVSILNISFRVEGRSLEEVKGQVYSFDCITFDL